MDPYENIPTIFSDFPGCNRFDFPEGIYRATAGRGGECFLIEGESLTALYDCGMAYCHRRLISNIEEILAKAGREKPDIILMSHTHYDHIGALPYIIERWPDIEVMGAEKAISVFASETAKATMVRLGNGARDIYGSEDENAEDVTADGMRVDRILKDGDIIDLGGRKIVAYETPGHTDCSMSYHVLPDDILFLSESSGLARGPELMHASILKDYRTSMASTDKCEKIGAKHLVSSHFGIVPESYSRQYFVDYRKVADEQYALVGQMMDEGAGYDSILTEFVSKYWSGIRGNSQPFDAFMENARIIVRNMMRSVTEDRKCQR